MQEKLQIYQDMKERTKGEIYIGVVGPVRTGKSTFIKRFMDLLVIPSMDESFEKQRVIDELPQSAAGKTIMTTEPKFIPTEAASIALPDDSKVNIRLIDCVGYMVDGAAGHTEGEQERRVKTPWFEDEIPFTQAAQIGTKKVIEEHSTIGFVVTTDGSFGEIPRENYEEPEAKTVSELKHLGKPFILLLNSTHPYKEETRALAKEMEDKYQVQVLPVNCQQLRKEDIMNMMEHILEEFPVARIDCYFPKWVEMLPVQHPVKLTMLQSAKTILEEFRVMRDVRPEVFAAIPKNENLENIKLEGIERKNGRVALQFIPPEACYYKTLSEMSGMEIEDEYQLIQVLKELSGKKDKFEKLEQACNEVEGKGYGVMIPDMDEVTLEEPQIIRHGNQYGVKIKAAAPSIHMIKAGIETEVAPIVGTKEQAEDLISYMMDNKSNPGGVWETNIFGKSVGKLVEDGIHGKVNRLTDESQMKLQETLQKVVNDSNGGLVCIII